MRRLSMSLIVSLICLLQLGMITCEHRFVFTMFRHGARAPEQGLNSEGFDILGEKWENPGELTSVGMRMHYLLGHKNKVKYQGAGYLSGSWDPNEMFVKSSDYNRTMMSVQSQLNGMFPPGTGPELTEVQAEMATPPNVPTTFKSEQAKLGSNALPHMMQVFPVHLFPKSTQIYNFFYNGALCTPCAKQWEINLKKDKIQDWITKFETNWGEKVRNALGTTDKNYFKDYHHLFLFFDTFISDYTDQRELRNLVKYGIDLAALNETAYDFEFNDIFWRVNDDEGEGEAQNFYARWSMSPIFGDVIAYMERRITLDKADKDAVYHSPNPKYVVYSAHDFTVGSAEVVLKSALEEYTHEYIYPSYASNIFLELHRTDGLTAYTDDDYSVKGIMNDVELFDVPWTKFKTQVQAKLFTKEEILDQCQFETEYFMDIWGWPVSYMHATVVLACILFVMVALIIVYGSYVCCCKKKGYNDGYEPASNKVMPTV